MALLITGMVVGAVMYIVGSFMENMDRLKAEREERRRQQEHLKRYKETGQW